MCIDGFMGSLSFCLPYQCRVTNPGQTPRWGAFRLFSVPHNGRGVGGILGLYPDVANHCSAVQTGEWCIDAPSGGVQPFANQTSVLVCVNMCQFFDYLYLNFVCDFHLSFLSIGTCPVQPHCTLPCQGLSSQ